MDTAEAANSQVAVLSDRLAEMQAALAALGRGEADALVGAGGVVSLSGAERPYQTFFNAMHEGGLTLDAAGRVLHCNPRFSAMLETPIEQLRGCQMLDLVATPDRQRLLDSLTSEVASSLVVELWPARGGCLPALLSITPVSLDRQRLTCLVVTDLREQRAAATSLQQSELKYRLLADNDADWVYWVDTSWRLRYVSPSCLKLSGYAPEDFLSDPTLMERIVHPEDLTVWRTYQAGAAGSARDEVNLRIVRRDQGVRWISHCSQPMTDAAGQPLGWRGNNRDITERKLADEKLQLAASVFTIAREGIMITSADGTIVDVNASFTRLTGFDRAEVLGQNPRILSSGRQSSAFYADMWRALTEQGFWTGEVWNRRKSGEVYAELQTVSAVRDGSGRIRLYVALFSDITAFKTHEQELERLAHYDALTGLPNRVLLADRLRQGMSQAQRHGRRLAVAYLDLDGFKAVNDRHGHQVGDQLLVTLAAEMKQTLREGDTLARLGGDEFVAVLLDLPDLQASLPMVERLLVAAARPVRVDALCLGVSACLGITFYPQAHEIDADQLLRQSDLAMYQAKLAGNNQYHVFDADHDRSVRGHHEQLERIRQALREREFVLYFQPKVNMRTGAVIGAEALIRWQHPSFGLLLPAQFLPVIEDHALAVDVGEWVIETALKQIEQWRVLGLKLPISVNVGARQLLQANFVERLQALLTQHPSMPALSLEIEVLETSALDDLERASKVIDRCRQLGVHFALDDFGTGFSSLTYLKRLPVNLLKIDQSFVRSMLDDREDQAILAAVVSLAAAFQRQVIAEGVETLAHCTLLLQLGCELAQGYGIARPMPAADLPGWVATWRPDPSWR